MMMMMIIINNWKIKMELDKYLHIHFRLAFLDLVVHRALSEL